MNQVSDFEDRTYGFYCKSQYVYGCTFIC